MEELNCEFTAKQANKKNCITTFFQSSSFIAMLIAVITLIIFSRVLWADFVMWDDGTIIYLNPNLVGLSLERLGGIFTDVDSMMRYNPLTLLGWSVTHYFFGFNPFWFHFGNWLLHGLNAGLVFLVLRKLLKLGFSLEGIKIWRINVSASLGALLWSLHPLRVEPVAWASDRTYGQSLFFLLISPGHINCISFSLCDFC